MIIGINQPYYLPYIGLFERIKACDLFVINPFSPLNRTRAFHRRVKIIQQHREASQKYLYLTQCIPHDMERKFYSEIKLDHNFWERQKTHIKTIYLTHKKAKYFDCIKGLLSLMENRNSKNLGEYNTKLIFCLAEILGLDGKLVNVAKNKKLREIDYVKTNPRFKNRSTKVTFNICTALRATVHIAGQNGPLWLDEKPFTQNGIKVFYQ